MECNKQIKEDLEDLIKEKNHLEEEIKELVWKDQFPEKPYEKDTSFPWKKILREQYEIVI